MNPDLEALARAVAALAPEPAKPEPPGPLLVIAGSLAEFRAFCLDENLRPGRDAVFIDRVEQLRGRAGFRWTAYGTRNYRTPELVWAAEERPGAEYVYIPSKRDERLRERDRRREEG